MSAETWAIVAIGLLQGIIVPAWAWLALRLIALEKTVAAMGRDVHARDLECSARLNWLQRMDSKLDEVREGVAELRGANHRTKDDP
jgi:hypothetical protein